MSLGWVAFRGRQQGRLSFMTSVVRFNRCACRPDCCRPRPGIGRIRRLFVEILSYESGRELSLSHGPFGVKVLPFRSDCVATGGQFFSDFLERSAHQAHLVLPRRRSKSLVIRMEWWIRAGTEPSDSAATSLHWCGVTVSIFSAPDVSGFFRSLRELRCMSRP